MVSEMAEKMRCGILAWVLVLILAALGLISHIADQVPYTITASEGYIGVTRGDNGEHLMGWMDTSRTETVTETKGYFFDSDHVILASSQVHWLVAMDPQRNIVIKPLPINKGLTVIASQSYIVVPEPHILLCEIPGENEHTHGEKTAVNPPDEYLLWRDGGRKFYCMMCAG